MRVLPTVLFALVACAAEPGCSSDTSQTPDRVAVGEWGGDHVALSVRDAGAVVEFDCAHGSIDQAMALDKNGRFDVRGRYVREHGGPVRVDETEDSRPARYTGSVDGRRMDLTIVLEDGQRIGPFQLVLGEPGRVFKCL